MIDESHSLLTNVSMISISSPQDDIGNISGDYNYTCLYDKMLTKILKI
jgi:hypothetical protein